MNFYQDFEFRLYHGMLSDVSLKSKQHMCCLYLYFKDMLSEH